MIFSVCGLITFLGNCTFLLGYISNNSIFPEALTMEGKKNKNTLRKWKMEMKKHVKS